MSSLDHLEQSHPAPREERRQTPRHRLGKLATIKLGIGIAPRYCLVTNVSAEGVCLHVMESMLLMNSCCSSMVIKTHKTEHIRWSGEAGRTSAPNS